MIWDRDGVGALMWDNVNQSNNNGQKGEKSGLLSVSQARATRGRLCLRWWKDQKCATRWKQRWNPMETACNMIEADMQPDGSNCCNLIEAQSAARGRQQCHSRVTAVPHEGDNGVTWESRLCNVDVVWISILMMRKGKSKQMDRQCNSVRTQVLSKLEIK